MLAIDDARSRAARVAARSELTDIRLFGVEAELESLPDREDTLSYTFNADVEVQRYEDAPALIVSGSYRVSVRVAVDPDAEPSGETGEDVPTIAEIKFMMAALYAVGEGSDEGGPLTEDELDAFAKTTGQFALHPYAREFIADLTGRMGLPPLHIGNLQVHLDRRNETD